MKKAFLIAILLVLGLASAGTAAHEKSFKASLTGDEVVPPVKTMSKGEAVFKPGKNDNEIAYKVTASYIENVNAVHIHKGKTGENGPPVATIDIKGKKTGKFSGTLAEGKITANELMGDIKGKSVKELIKEIKAGNAYVNVHTDKHPDGEIRGQIR